MSADWSNFGEVLAKSRMLVKKSASTRGKLRKGELNNNPISEIFGGQFREETMEFGKKTAKVRTQEFFTLHLKVTPECDMFDSLAEHFKGDFIEDYRNEQGEVVRLQRVISVERLPNILVVHIMRYGISINYNAFKKKEFLYYPVEFEFDSKYLSKGLQARVKGKKQQYELISVISHKGKQIAKGHYVCHVNETLSRAKPDWVRYDDKEVKSVPARIAEDLQAYVLFYKKIT